MDTYDVLISRQAEKELTKIPAYIGIKLQAWIDSVCNSGLQKTRKIPGYHDEPLIGKLLGLRSVRLSKKYRLIYQIEIEAGNKVINILRVNNHDYKVK